MPTWRAADTTREVDLIEEVMRIAGIERVPAAMPGGAPRRRPAERRRAAAPAGRRRRCAAPGLSEAATLTLWDVGVPDRLRLGADDPPPRPGRAPEPDERRVGGDADARLPRAFCTPPARIWRCGRPGLRCSRSATCSCAATEQAARPAGARGGRARRRGGRVLRGQGRRRGAARGRRAHRRCPSSGRRTSRSCIPGARPRSPTASSGELHPLVAEAFGLEVARRRVRAGRRRPARPARARRCSTAT